MTAPVALFVGCKIPARVPEYERSSRAVLQRLGVRLVDLDFGCCGYPARHLRLDAHLVLAARNLALAGARGLDVLTLCQCCYGNLRHAQHLIAEEQPIRDVLTRALAAEGLVLTARTRVRHLLELLTRDVGLEAIAAQVTNPQRGRRVAAHYGCHALRPSHVCDLDNPHAPSIFESLVRAAGAEAVDWPRRLDCCGAPIGASSPVLADRIRTGKLADAREAGAEYLCTACPWCHERFATAAAPEGLPTLLVTELLGRAMGLPASVLRMR
jgi:heterodisulfide reductase subunit B2